MVVQSRCCLRVNGTSSGSGESREDHTTAVLTHEVRNVATENVCSFRSVASLTFDFSSDIPYVVVALIEQATKDLYARKEDRTYDAASSRACKKRPPALNGRGSLKKVLDFCAKV